MANLWKHKLKLFTILVSPRSVCVWYLCPSTNYSMAYNICQYIVPSVDWYHHWRNRSSSFGGERTQTATRQAYKFPKSKYFATLTCSHGGVKVKMKCMLHIYTVPSVDWYHHWINQSSSFGGEANTNYYPSHI